MNSKQRIERIEERRQRNRVTIVTTGDDARQRILDRLQRLAERMPPEAREQAQRVPLVQLQEQLQAVMQQARADYEQQRKQPKSPAWLKLQRKQKPH